MKNTNLLLACALLSSAVASAKPQATGAKASKASPEGPQIMWGQPVRGLQLGAMAALSGPSRMDSTVLFPIMVRNVGKKPVTVAYSRFAKLWHPPIVERADKKPLSGEQKAAVQNFANVSAFRLSGPSWKEQLILQPWISQHVAFGEWTMEPVEGSSASGQWAWDLWAPGKYNFTYSMTFESSEQSGARVPRWTTKLKAKPVTVEFIADEPTSAPKPQ